MIKILTKLNVNFQSIKEKCDNTLQQITEFWSQLPLDGVNNLWILKPAAKSRGRGILILKNLEDILYKISSLQSKDSRYVAQKYIGIFNSLLHL